MFYAALDDYAPQLIGLYKKRKTGRVGERMEQLLLAYGKQVFKNTNYYSACLAVAIVMFIYIYIYLFVYLFIRTKTTSMQLEQQLWPAYQCTSRRILQRFSKHARYLGITIICTLEFKKG